MNKITAVSPAKINIGLNITGKRDDGFHNLETIFYPLLLSDTIIFQKADRTKFTSNSKVINELSSNLIIDAIDLIKTYTKSEIKVDISLEKNIPIGAGLGGGSSNAGVTLKSINQLFELNLDHSVLSGLAIELGSDVPYFLNPHPCFASSRGEILTKINLSLSQPILIVNPGINISTAWAFNQLKIEGGKNPLRKIKDKTSITIDDIYPFAKNDFEMVVFKEYPEIKSIKEKLISLGADFSLMTGTGSTVFGIFSDLQKARFAQNEFDKEYFTFLNYAVDSGSIT